MNAEHTEHFIQEIIHMAESPVFSPLLIWSLLETIIVFL